MSQQKRRFFRQWKDRRNQQWALAVLVLIVLMVSTVLWLRASRPPEEASGEEHVEATDTDIVTLDVAAQRNIGLKTETAQTKTLVQTIQTTGVVGPNETRVGHIRPLARGRIEKVYVRLGDRVRAGQPLLAYDNIELGELIGDFLKALAVLEQKSTEAEVAKQALERAQNLVELGAVARAEYERRNAEYKNALAAINSQKATIAQVEEKLHRFGLTDAELEKLSATAQRAYHREASHSVVRAPFDGIVIKYDVAEGEVVNTDRELLTIADLSIVWVLADVYEKDLALIREGQEVKIVMDAYPGEAFRGKLTYVSDFLDPKTRTAKVRCEVRNLQARLKLDMFATIHIPTPIGLEAVMIPTSAVQQIDNQPVVFVRLNDTQFQRREVQLGAQSDGWVEVKSGVKAGEAVVTQGSFYVKSALLREQIGGEEGH